MQPPHPLPHPPLQSTVPNPPVRKRARPSLPPAERTSEMPIPRVIGTTQVRVMPAVKAGGFSGISR